MRAAILREFATPFVVEDVDVLPPGPEDVLVRTGAAAFCITDVINQRGELGKHPPTILGHSAVGIVEEVGSDVNGFRPGELVLCGGTPECGVCQPCARARPDQCDALFAPPVPVGRTGSGLDVTATAVGGYAEIMRLPQSWVFPLRSELPVETLSLLGCGITTGLGAVFNIADVRPGSTVAVVGCGQLGLWMVQAARVARAARIIAVEPIAERRRLAGELGATDLVDPGDGGAVEQVRELTSGSGADYVLEAAGDVSAMAGAVLMARNIGVVVMTGVQTAKAAVTLPAVELAVRGKEIRQCQNGRVRMRRDVPRFVELMESGAVTAKPLISGSYPLESINEIAERSYGRTELTPVLVPTVAE